MIRCAFAFVCAVLFVGGVGCVSPPKAYLPVDNQLRPWQAPEGLAEEGAPTPPATPAPKKPSK